MNCKLLLLRSIYEKNKVSQRDLSKEFFISLGKVNNTLKDLIDEGLIDKSPSYNITQAGIKILNDNKVDCALILACGNGIKLFPSGYDIPKAFIEIEGISLVERQIQQLNESGIFDITIMVGYLKEKFDYLIDKYNVNLVYNKEYKTKNTLSTLFYAKDIIKGKNCYISVCDIYMKNNLFHLYEFEPYYNGIYYDNITKEWQVGLTVQNEIFQIMVGGKETFCLAGFSYWTREFCDKILYLIERYYSMPQTDSFFWEDILMRNIDILPPMYLYKREFDNIVEFDSVDDLREYKNNNYSIGSFPYQFIAKSFETTEDNIICVNCVKLGVSNNSYTFKIKNDEQNRVYVARVPINNNNIMIDRQNEKIVYDLLMRYDMTDIALIIDDKTGIKISLYYENAKKIDKNDKKKLKIVLEFYKKFHNLNIKYNKGNNISLSYLIDKYHKILVNKKIDSLFIDFNDSFNKCAEIIEIVNKYKRPQILIHGSMNIDNILFVDDKIRLIDFENAGLGEPLDDLAMFCAYSFLSINECLDVLDMYLNAEGSNDLILNQLNEDEIKKIFLCKVSLANMLNTLWCMYMATVSIVDFGEFQMKNYRMFKNMFNYLKNVIGNDK